ncbi:MAG: CoA pyrophosphatase, partial [Paracoccaceae bacterium]|nr:CoA pyrophosphatase [Paracoccaceae bacterium]
MDARNAVAKLQASLGRPLGASSDFDLNPEYRPPAGRILRPAAVLVPLWVRGDAIRVILTKRSSRLKHHPGQIAFPGGKVDPEDASAEAAALREAWEEIGLNPADVEVLGQLPAHETVTNFRVTPVLGMIRADFTACRADGEVEEIFDVPFAHVSDPSRFVIERRRWRGDWRNYYTLPYGPYYIWGATARILHALAQRVVE